MTPLHIAVAGGMIVLAGLLLLAAALRPAPPRLSLTLEQLTAQPRGPRTGTAVEPTGLDVRIGRLPTGLRRILTSMGAYVDERDLQITGTSRTGFTLEKSLVAGLGMFLPAVAIGLLTLAGMRLPWAAPTVLGPLLAAMFWWSYDRDLRAKAAARRTEFTAALTAYLALVGLERQVRGSPTEALEEASRISGSWPFRLIHTEVLRAELSGAPPWEGLRDLGRRIGVEHLEDLADIVATAADGAAVFSTLMAEARALRHQDNALQKQAANVVSENLSQPVALLAMGYLLLMIVPPMLRLFLT
jgi:hypothetical protein